MINHRKSFEDIDRNTDSWFRIFNIVNDNYDKVVYRIEFEGRRFILEDFEVKKAATKEYFLSSYYVPWRNNITIWIDGVRQYAYRDFTETDSQSFILKNENEVVYHSNLKVLYAIQENDLADYSTAESLIKEYEEAAGDYHDPKDRVRANLEEIIDDFMDENKIVRDKADFYLSSYDELIKSLEYLENYEDSGRFPEGKYYLTPIVDGNGTIRWVKSMPNMKKPRSRTFTGRLSLDDGVIFIGNGEDKPASAVLGSGVVLNDEARGAHYDYLPISLGGTGGDNHYGARVTDLLVIDNHQGLTNGKMPYGIVNNTAEPDTEYNPGFVTGVLPVELGGTGTVSTVGLYESQQIPVATSLDINLLSTVSYNKVMSNLSSYSKYIGKSFSLPTTSPIYGNMKFIVIGVGKQNLITGSRPKFTLMASSPITRSPLTRTTAKKYLTYDKLDILQNTLDTIYSSIVPEVKKQLSLANDILLDDINEGTMTFGVLNPSNKLIGAHYGYSMNNKYLWLPSLSEFDLGAADRIIPPNYYDYFSFMAVDRLVDIIGEYDGIWTRSQSLSDDSAKYYAIMRDGSIQAMTTDSYLGIAPLICI